MYSLVCGGVLLRVRDLNNSSVSFLQAFKRAAVWFERNKIMVVLLWKMPNCCITPDLGGIYGYHLSEFSPPLWVYTNITQRMVRTYNNK